MTNEQSYFGITYEQIYFIQSLEGQKCLHSSIYRQSMHYRPPYFETITFNPNSIVKFDADGNFSSYGFRVNIEERGNQLIITVTDGKDKYCTNEIYIFKR